MGKKKSYILNFCLNPCVFYSQLKCSYKRKDNYVIHLLVASKEMCEFTELLYTFAGLQISFSKLTHFRQELLIRLFVSLIAAKRRYRKIGLLISDLTVQSCPCRWVSRGPLKLSYSLEMLEPTSPPAIPRSSCPLLKIF